MKYLTSFGVPLLVIIFCLYVYKQDAEKKEKQISAEALIDKARQDTARYDTIFLGYRLGMTHKEYIDHNVELMISNKIRNKGQSNLNIYDTQLGEYAAEAEFGAEFYEDKLCILITSYKLTGTLPHGELTYVLLRNYVTQKYGFDFIEQETGKFLSDGDKLMSYIWIDGNRKIYLYMSDDDNAVVVYEDWKMQELKKKAEEDAKKRKSEQLKSDL